MNELLDAMLERVRTWPQERQAYAVEVLKLIEAQVPDLCRFPTTNGLQYWKATLKPNGASL